jgi:hypothetical protein
MPRRTSYVVGRLPRDGGAIFASCYVEETNHNSQEDDNISIELYPLSYFPMGRAILDPVLSCQGSLHIVECARTRAPRPRRGCFTGGCVRGNIFGAARRGVNGSSGADAPGTRRRSAIVNAPRPQDRKWRIIETRCSAADVSCIHRTTTDIVPRTRRE